MILSLNLLFKINPKLKKFSVDKISKALMDLGCEVETINRIQPSSNLVFARVIEKQKHPNSDHLNLVKVKVNHEIYDIVCGADNFQLYDWVILAKPQAQLANGLVIQPRKVRDFISNGMLCAYQEINPQTIDLLDETTKKGIVVLVNKNNHTLSVEKLLNLDDIILDLSIPSNRNDLNGYLWITKELSAYFNIDFSIDSFVNARSHNELKKVRVSSDDVNSYALVEVNNVQHNLTWDLKSFLINNQTKIIGNFADYMNYLTLITANPLHAFDKDKISGQIVLINAEEDAKMIGLDNKEYEIKKGDLIIKDEQKIIALAGIIGSKDSSIDVNTTTALIECANFNPLTIAKTARRLKINTVASARFSKPLTNFVTKTTLKQILKTFGVNATLVCYFKHIVHNVIKNKIKDVQTYLGSKINFNEAYNFLERLGYKINKNNLITPDHRYDVLNEFDVYEDIIKKFSINQITPKPISFDILNFKNNIDFDNENKIANKLIHLGIYEAKTYNLKANDQAKSFDIYDFKQSYTINNPISNIRSDLKLNNINTLLEVVEYNLNQKNGLHNFFEFSNISPLNLKQQRILSIVLTKDLLSSKLNDSKITNNLLTAKAIAFEILEELQVNFKISLDFKYEGFYQQNSIALVDQNNALIGFVGQLNNKSKKPYGLSNDVFAINLNLTNYLQNEVNTNKVIKPSNLNDIIKDISVSLNDNINLIDLINQLKTIKYINNVNIIDVFRKEEQNIYTFKFNLNAYDKTLNQEEINLIEQDIYKVINNFK